MWATGSGASRPRHSPCVLQGFPHAGTVLDLHFPFQQHALRDFLQSRTRRGLRGLCGRRTRLTLFWPRATCFPRAGRHHKPGLHHGASRTHGAVQPALDKTENSITVLGRNIQQNRHPGIPGNAGNPAQDPVKGASFPKTFKHPPRPADYTSERHDPSSRPLEELR